MKHVIVWLSFFCLCIFANQSPAASDFRDLSWTERVITEDELLKLERYCPALDVNTSREILARLNTKEQFYIRDDMRHGRKLKVPNDFNTYKDWSPLPVQLPAGLRFARFILIVKDIPFLGWYESGVLLNDSQACIGNSAQDTRTDFTRSKIRTLNTCPVPTPTISENPHGCRFPCTSMKPCIFMPATFSELDAHTDV